jgi:hypothetical protein
MELRKTQACFETLEALKSKTTIGAVTAFLQGIGRPNGESSKKFFWAMARFIAFAANGNRTADGSSFEEQRERVFLATCNCSKNEDERGKFEAGRRWQTLKNPPRN